jgi:DNA-binding LacI/PurR family transcriptional regulator
MPEIYFPSITEQVTTHLRDEIRKGRWTETLPGRTHLRKILNVSGVTVDHAIAQLEREGLIVPQGQGRRRLIALDPKDQIASTSLRIRILCYEVSDRNTGNVVNLRHRLTDAGHHVNFSTIDLRSLNMDVQRVALYVKKTPADAWIIHGGSHAVLEWFLEQSIPAFAMGGKITALPIAGGTPIKSTAVETALSKLFMLGHRRIAFLVHEEGRKPAPGQSEQLFLKRLEAQGITTSSYNLPDWNDDLEGFQQCLKSLFLLTPPTAIIIETPDLFFAALQYLAERGITAPRDVSLICAYHDEVFNWCKPSISCIKWSFDPIINHVVQWSLQVARGENPKRQLLSKAEFVEGGTIGPVPDEQ